MKLSTLIIRLIDLFYFPFVARIFTRQMFHYAACGGLNFIVLDPLLYFVAHQFVVTPERYFDLGFVVLSPHIAALILVFPLTTFNGFWLNRHVVFQESDLRRRTQFMRYVLSIGGSLFLTYAGMKFFVELCGVWPTPSKLLTTLLVTIYSFLAAKYFSFKKKN